MFVFLDKYFKPLNMNLHHNRLETTRTFNSDLWECTKDNYKSYPQKGYKVKKKADTDTSFSLGMTATKLYETTSWKNCYGFNRTYSKLNGINTIAPCMSTLESSFPLMTYISLEEKLINMIKYPSLSELH